MNKETSDDKICVSGKRKRCVARATIFQGDGKIRLNNIPYEFLPTMQRLMIEEPLRIAKEKMGNLNYNIVITTRGGGQEAGIEAARLAISRALIKISKSKELKKAFLDYDRALLVADTRRKEAYKPGDSKARTKRQKSYR